MEILVDCNRALQVEKMLKDRDIAFEVTRTNSWNNLLAHRLRSPRTMIMSNCGFMNFKSKFKGITDRALDWNDYYPLNVVYKWMDDMEKMYPATCTVCPIGKSVEGRYIKMLKISNTNARNTGVWIDGCVHAREWISVCVVTYIIDYIARNFCTLPKYITDKDWYFVPVVNPDGYHYTHNYDRLWRKSRARFGNIIVGVDLNRNFGYNWGQCGVDAVPLGDPTHHNYRGQDPFSEPETSAIKDMILYSGTPFKIFLTFHAHSEVISFPWCYTSEPCPDYVNLLEGAAAMAAAMFETTGKMYKVGNFKDVMYFASGTSIDWSYGTAKIPFSYLVELRSKIHKFQLPKSEIMDCCKEALAGVMALAEFVETRKCLNCVVLDQKLR